MAAYKVYFFNFHRAAPHSRITARRFQIRFMMIMLPYFYFYAGSPLLGWGRSKQCTVISEQ